MHLCAATVHHMSLDVISGSASISREHFGDEYNRSPPRACATISWNATKCIGWMLRLTRCNLFNHRPVSMMVPREKRERVIKFAQCYVGFGKRFTAWLEFSPWPAVWLAVKQHASPPGTGRCTSGNVSYLLAHLELRPLRFPEFAFGPQSPVALF